MFSCVKWAGCRGMGGASTKQKPAIAGRASAYLPIIGQYVFNSCLWASFGLGRSIHRQEPVGGGYAFYGDGLGFDGATAVHFDYAR